jgi:16S rRNA processing protein RimM
MLAADAWVPLAEVLRPHGLRGEVRLRLFNQDSDVLLSQDDVLVRLVEGDEQEVSVDGARRAGDAILLKLHSVDDRDRASELRGALVCVRRGSFPELEQGEFYTCDVIGARVLLRDSDAGLREIGTVRSMQSYPSADTLLVRATDGGKDWEVPLLQSFVEKVDVAEGVVHVATLEGLERA